MGYQPDSWQGHFSIIITILIYYSLQVAEWPLAKHKEGDLDRALRYPTHIRGTPDLL